MSLFHSHDEQFFEGLMKASYPKLLAIAKHLAADKDSAEDLVQETYLTAWAKIDAVKASPNPDGWLVNTLRNKLRHYYKAYYKEKANVDSNPNPPAGSLNHQAEDDEIGLASMLTPDELMILNLKVQGFKHREIAKKMNSPLGTIDSKVFRLKAKIAQLLKDK